MPEDRQATLQGRWVHSHEEDSDDEMVFRPADHPFPRSRGRTELDLRADGSYVETSPGPTDVPEAHNGSWSLREDGVLELSGDVHALAPELRVAEVSGDRLVVRR